MQIIVERASEILGYDNEGSSYIDGDHHTICKYGSTDDAGYRDISKLLRGLIADLPSQKW